MDGCPSVIDCARGHMHAVHMRPAHVHLDGPRALNAWQVIDMDTLVPIRTLRGHTKGLHAFTICESAEVIVSGGLDHTLRLWSFASDDCLGTLEGHSTL